MDQEKLVHIIKEITVKTLEKQNEKLNEIPIAVSNRHVHLSTLHLERLFGKGYQLQKLKDLSQPNQFAAKETVTLIGAKGKIEKVRVLGPARGETQVEVSLYDGYTLGVTPPIRNSGDIEGSPAITIQGPRGQIKLEKGLICAARHIHMHTSDAEKLEVRDGEHVQIKVAGERGVIFDHVLIRVSPHYRLEMHIDLDEANAAHIQNGQIGTLIKLKGGKK
ncbi:phosphate propanoyltransferase [Bacillus salitolerans]|uniref:Phosphate propanoyltransferase n=1 Tax=Bacillus salitolerans TaxID=1437434 RepID=A0ABW4LN74_9BACI